jgi:hypothetical protein
MNPPHTPNESFGTIPGVSEAADDGANGVLLPHSDSDATELQRVRDLLFGATSRAQSSRVDSVEAALTNRLEALEVSFGERLKAAEAQVREDFRLDEHGTRKVERADLRSMLADLADRIGD